MSLSTEQPTHPDGATPRARRLSTPDAILRGSPRHRSPPLGRTGSDQGERTDQGAHRYLAGPADVTQAEMADRAVAEYAARHADAMVEGIERARRVLAGGDAAIASHLLGVPRRGCPAYSPALWYGTG